jgi:hypothetical protein
VCWKPTEKGLEPHVNEIAAIEMESDPAEMAVVAA